MSLSSIKSEIWNRFCAYLDPTGKRNNKTVTVLFQEKDYPHGTISAGNGAVSFGLKPNFDSNTERMQSIIEEMGDRLERADKSGQGQITFLSSFLTNLKCSNRPNLRFFDCVKIFQNSVVQASVWKCTRLKFQEFLARSYHVDCLEKTKSGYHHFQGTWVRKEGNLELCSSTNTKLEWTLSWYPSWYPIATPTHPLPQFDGQSISHGDFGVSLWEAATKGEYTDVTISCGDNEIVKAHKLILHVKSSVLSTMLAQAMSEGNTGCISLPETSNAVTTVIKYLYLDIGALYKSRILLKTYDAYRIRNGQRLLIAFKDAYRACGLPIPMPSCRVHTQCDVWHENTLGIRIAPTFEYSIRYEWNPSIDGWSGYAPVGIEFKFVKILPDDTVVCEKLEGNRLISEESDEILKLDVQF